MNTDLDTDSINENSAHSVEQRPGLRKATSEVVAFLTTGIWRIQRTDLSRPRAFFVGWLRVLMLAGKGFREDRCALTASGLTYYTLLSIVPLFAMLFGIAKGFGLHRALEVELLQKFPGQQAILTQVFDFSQSLLQNTRGGLIAGLGVGLLFWTVIKLLGNIEGAFNHIWEVKKPRSFVRKFSDYLSIMLVCPLAFLISSSATIFFTAQLTNLTENVAFSEMIGPAILFLLKLLPYALIWMIFTFIYVVMPNAKVQLKAGILAAVIAGSIYQVGQWGYVEFQVGVARQNAIYGSFAALPLFLIWVQLSWLIVLLGAEISFAIQHADTLEFGHDSSKLSPFDSKLAALLITRLIVRRFADGAAALTAPEIATALVLPLILVRDSLQKLESSGILSRIESTRDEEQAYQPASDISVFSVAHIIERLEKNGAGNIPFKQTQELENLTEALDTFDRATASSPTNKLLKDI